MYKIGITVFVTFILLGAQVSAQDYQIILRGGHVNQEFRSCNTGSCGPSSYCCRFSNTQYATGYAGADVSYFCMNDFQTSNQNSGIYQDQENYPFERYYWDCGYNKRYNSNWDSTSTGIDDATIPIELNNNDFWIWTWLILFTFFVSPGGYVLGYIVYWPLTTIMALYNWAVTLYSTGILIFEYPQRLQFNEWLLFPIRRHFIQQIIISLGYLWLLVPVLNIFVMPALGLWYVHDFLDYQGWDQVTSTVGMPFNGYDSRTTADRQSDPHYYSDHNQYNDNYYNNNNNYNNDNYYYNY